MTDTRLAGLKKTGTLPLIVLRINVTFPNVHSSRANTLNLFAACVSLEDMAKLKETLAIHDNMKVNLDGRYVPFSWCKLQPLPLLEKTLFNLVYYRKPATGYSQLVTQCRSNSAWQSQCGIKSQMDHRYRFKNTPPPQTHFFLLQHFKISKTNFSPQWAFLRFSHGNHFISVVILKKEFNCRTIVA